MICSTQQEDDPWLECPVGELGDDKVTTLAHAPVGSGEDHVCGTEHDFDIGGAYLPSEPPVHYSATGLPDCCGPMPLRRGGAGASGRPVVQVIPAVTRGGGAGASGRCEITYQPTRDASAGGVETGGSAGDVYTPALSVSGGVEVGGSVGEVFVQVDATAGGVVTGGSTGDVLALTDSTAGGVEVGGSVGEVFVQVDATAGGVEVGGSSGDTYTPGTVVPGTTCATAGAITTGTTYSANTATTPGSQQWWSLVLSASTLYHVTSTGISGGMQLLAQVGTSCAGITGSTACFSPCTAFTTSASGLVWLLQINGAPGVHAYTLRVDPGAC